MGSTRRKKPISCAVIDSLLHLFTQNAHHFRMGRPQLDSQLLNTGFFLLGAIRDPRQPMEIDIADRHCLNKIDIDLVLNLRLILGKGNRGKWLIRVQNWYSVKQTSQHCPLSDPKKTLIPSLQTRKCSRDIGKDTKTNALAWNFSNCITQRSGQ